MKILNPGGSMFFCGIETDEQRVDDKHERGSRIRKIVEEATGAEPVG